MRSTLLRLSVVPPLNSFSHNAIKKVGAENQQKQQGIGAVGIRMIWEIKGNDIEILLFIAEHESHAPRVLEYIAGQPTILARCWTEILSIRWESPASQLYRVAPFRRRSDQGSIPNSVPAAKRFKRFGEQ